MSSRRIALSILASLFLLPHGCSENTNTKPEEEPPFENTISFEYETDDALAVSENITPAGGQSLECTGPDGTSYSLSFAPGAVSQTTTVTVTPLKYLRIIHNTENTDPVPPVLPSTQACNVGALFEPAGLELDSTVVLTVTFPDTVSCAVNDSLRLIYIDPTRSFYSLVPTAFDAGTSALSCTLSHFSLYGTDAPGYEYLKTLIEQTTEYGVEFPSLPVVTDLVHCGEEALRGNWPDLLQLADAGARTVLKALAPIVVAKALDDLTDASMDELMIVVERAEFLAADDAMTILDNGLRSIIDKMILRGKEWCGSDREDEGRAMLMRAWNYVQLGIVNFPDEDAKIAEIEDALNACSGLRITVVSYKPILYDLALNETSEDTYTDFEVEVLNHVMDPVEGETVELVMSHVGDPVRDKILPVQTTDSDGKARFRFGYGRFDMPDGRYVLIAKVFYNDEWHDGLGSVELKRIRVTLNYSYTYTYASSSEDGYRNVSASFSSSGTKAVRGGADCPEVERSLSASASSGGGEYTSTHTLLPPHPDACFFQIYHRFVYTDDEFQTPVFVLNKLSVGMRGASFCKMERVVTEPDYSDTDIILQDAIDYFGMVYPPGPESYEVLLDYDGGFEGFTYSETTPDGHGNGQLIISANVEE